MTWWPGIAAALLLGGCGGGEPATGNDTASAAPAPVPSDLPVPRTPATTLPAGDGIPGVSAPAPVETPVPAPAPAAPVAAEALPVAAVAVLRDYFAAIADGRHAAAYRLWGNGGQAAGMSGRAFADSFARYADYRATIGPPGRIVAGAGQRYIEVPVQVTARLRDGTPARLEGRMTLHRTADIDGATAEQRSWRIVASALEPRPATDGAPAR